MHLVFLFWKSPEKSVSNIIAILLLWAMLLPALPAGSAQYRSLKPIASPTTLPENAVRPPRLQPVQRNVIEYVVRRFADSWNTGKMADFIDPDFWNKNRLLDTLMTDAPRDARLRILSIRNTQTLNQYIVPKPQGRAHQVSEVSVVVNTQIEYNDSQDGFQKIEGVNEFIIKIIQKAAE